SRGAALITPAGPVSVTNSTISNNTGSVGGGVSNSLGYYGSAGSVTITNSTISGNRANGGGGVYNIQSCFYDSFNRQTSCNSAALTLNDSLIAGNQAAAGPEIENAIILRPMSLVPVNNVTANN